MNIRIGKSKSSSRDLGLDHNGPGKGSASRITDTKAFADNFDEIDWGRTPTREDSIALAEEAICAEVNREKP